MYLYTKYLFSRALPRGQTVTVPVKDLTTLFFFQIFDMCISVVRGSLWGSGCFYPVQSGGGFVSSTPELVSVYHSHLSGDWRFLPKLHPSLLSLFFVWFKSAHSLPKSAHKGQSSVCHVSPFPVCLIDQSGIFSWHSPQPQPSPAPKRHQILLEFALLHVSAAVMHPDEQHFEYCRLKKMKKNEFIITLQNKTGCSIQLYLQFASHPALFFKSVLNAFHGWGSAWGGMEVRMGMEEIMEGMGR